MTDTTHGLTNDQAMKKLLQETDALLESHSKSLEIPSYLTALRKPEFILCIFAALVLILPALLSITGYPVNSNYLVL
jgi:hypothetical protein